MPVLQTITSQCASVGVAGKFGGIFASLPQAMVSGLFCVMFGLIAAVGISQLQFTDMNSPRNIFITGLGLYLSLSIPDYFNTYTTKNNHGPINTGAHEFNGVHPAAPCSCLPEQRCCLTTCKIFLCMLCMQFSAAMLGLAMDVKKRGLRVFHWLCIHLIVGHMILWFKRVQ